MQMFPHHDDNFLQALCEHVPSSLEMTTQKHVPCCLDDSSDGEPSHIISRQSAVEEPATSE